MAKNNTEEIERMYRVSDQLLTAHAILRDRYQRISVIFDSLVLILATVVSIGMFVSHREIFQFFGISLSWNTASILLGTVVFILTILELRIGWKQKASAHDGAIRVLASVESKMRQYLNRPNDITDIELVDAITRYDTSLGGIVAIPDKKFNALKARHKRKVLISRHLDEHPFTNLFLLKIKLFFKHKYKNK